MTEKTSGAGKGGFINPFRTINKIGDPFMLYDAPSGRYYLYCTGGHYHCWSSADLAEWTDHGDSYAVTEKSFGELHYWAPEVYPYRGAYYMVHSAAVYLENGKKRHSIGIARSEKPEGPFTDVLGHPLFSPGYSVIDASLFFDDDGRIYLLCARDHPENIVNGRHTSQIYGIELNADLTETVGEAAILATPEQDWELLSGNVIWNEGPCLFKRNGVYYLLYTANYYASVHYTVGYATASAPLGPYLKGEDAKLLQGDGVFTSGTGHCNVTRSPDGTETYIVYHSHTDVTNTQNPIADRTPCADKLVVLADGKLHVNGPCVCRQPLPSGTLGYCKVHDESVSTDCETVSGDAKRLTDGAADFGRFSESLLYTFKPGTGAITLHYDRPVCPESVWIYGAADRTRSPKGVYAVINGRKTERLTFSGKIPSSPVRMTSEMLGKNKVTEITLRFDGAETVSLSEIVTVELQ